MSSPANPSLLLGANNDTQGQWKPASSESHSEDNYERDETYYCNDIFLLVEGCLFKIPRAVLNGSETFRDMFNDLPVPEGQPVDGSSYAHPLRLGGVEKTDFRRLLDVILPLKSSMGPPPTRSQEEWVSILKLATMWHFEFIRTSAISALSSLSIDPIEKIILSYKYDVPQWNALALNELARRDSMINEDECNRLLPTVGLGFLLKLVQVRENVISLSELSLQCQNCSGSPFCKNCRNYNGFILAGTGTVRSQHDFTPSIVTVFGL